MKSLVRQRHALWILLTAQLLVPAALASCIDAFDVSLRKLHSKQTLNFCELVEGKPLLVVNTASHCGFTRQFEALENIHKEYEAKGLVVVGFASNDFFQAAKSEEKAAEVCFKNFGVSFTMFAPSHIRGRKANPAFEWLAEQSGKPSWNFNKYLVTADRQQVTRFGSRVEPDSEEFIAALEKLL